jgi:hypothetical protein
MFDTSGTTTLPCTSTTVCPIVTSDCNPPYDWYPKQYTFDLKEAASVTFNVPTVKDCLGRVMIPYATPAVAPINNGAFDSRDSTIFTSGSFFQPPASGTPGTFGYTFAAPMS